MVEVGGIDFDLKHIICKGNFHTLKFSDCILMQSTGLKDRDGVEIYEGDVVKWKSTYSGGLGPEHIDIVQWEDGSFLLMPWIHEINAAEKEVIGNIHQNSELKGK